MNTANLAETAIRCQDLCKSYGEVEALKDLNLSIPSGSIFGFLGRNGAGKTTTIRLLTGLAHPSSGSAWVAGVETTNGQSNAREKFGYLPQHPAFYGWMTPVEYLDYICGLFNLPSEKCKKRIPEMLSLVQLEKAAKRHISGFSGGMIQRLGIAQALIHEPPVLFLDEPASALDPAGRYELLDMIDSLRGRVTVFLSSHILADVERICDLVGIIHEGRLLFVSERRELFERYAVNAVLLEFDPLSRQKIEAFSRLLEGLPWVSLVQPEGVLSLRISVKETNLAKESLLPLLVEQGLVLEAYRWVKPTLEEIFLQVSV